MLFVSMMTVTGLGLVVSLLQPVGSHLMNAGLTKRSGENLVHLHSSEKHFDGQTQKDALEILIKVISRWENCHEWRNPGCLRFRNQRRAKANKMGYATFDSHYWGKLALRRDLFAKLKRGNSVEKILTDWSPSRRTQERLLHEERLVLNLNLIRRLSVFAE